MKENDTIIIKFICKNDTKLKNECHKNKILYDYI